MDYAAAVPELPEVETVARQLAPSLEGRTLRRLRILDPRLRDGPLPKLAGRVVQRVDRSGKQVRIRLSARPGGRDPVWALVHLRMTGRLLWLERPERRNRAHLRAKALFERGALLFVDTRRFGTLRFARSEHETLPAGVEPLSPSFTRARLQGLLRGSVTPLKPWLLRQDRIAGLGNIYASEIAHEAGLSPLRPAGALDADEVARLHRAVRAVLRRAIRNCGTTFSDFQDARGVEGGYQRLLRVYDRPGEPCPRCGGRIERRVQQQRSTFYCPSCQR